MPENKTPQPKKPFSLDWLVRGTLTRLGDMFDGLTGRSWKPSSSIATSELIERLKKLLDTEARDAGGGKLFVPHQIKLKTQWDKFAVNSENSEKALKTLENELLVAAIDHINDRRYHTYAPIHLEIKPDYFTEGVKLQASFDKFAEDEHEGEMNVSLPDLKNVILNAPPEVEPEKEFFVAQFKIGAEPKNVVISFVGGERKSVGRTKQSDLFIDDASVSKIHASLVLNANRKLMVADTGSTNGTFVSGQRIPYGKAFLVNHGERLKFGTVEVVFQYFENKSDLETVVEEPNAERTAAQANFTASENGAAVEENISPSQEISAAQFDSTQKILPGK